MQPRILLVEDEEHLARGLSFNLEAEGWAVERLERAEGARERLANGALPRIDLVLLDVMLPGMSGLDLLRALRVAGEEVPVLLLTARDAEQEIVEGLDAGADDYLTKPFSLAVLLARVRRLLRRTPRDGDAATPAFTIGDATIHPDRFEVERGGQVRPLTAKELGLLVLLHARRGSAVSRGDILREVWDLDPTTRTRVVDTFMLRLRKLIEPDPACPRHLLSVRSHGYRLADD
jgi:DNA-binding response OmpR family regulator